MNVKKFVILTLALAPVLAFATTPRKLPKVVPPHATPAPPGPPPAPYRSVAPLPAASPEVIHSLGLSTTVEMDLLYQYERTHRAGAAPGLTTEAAAARVANPASGNTLDPYNTDNPLHVTQVHPRLNVGTDTTPAGFGRVTNDSLGDIEPALITNQWNGVNTTFHVWTKFDANHIPHHYWSSTTNNVNFSAPQPLPVPTDPATGLAYTRTSDPWLSENPYGASGVFPSRTYASGLAYDIDTNNADHNPDGSCPPTGGCTNFPQHNALVVWWNDRSNPNCDPSTQSWCKSVLNYADYPLGFDKPSITTSWDVTNGTLGDTYAAAIVVHYDQTQYGSTGSGSRVAGTGYHDIQIYRQTNNWQGFYYVSQPFSDVLITSPVLIVNPTAVSGNPGSQAGDLYLCWVDWRYHVIQMARSTTQGSSFGSPVTLFPPVANSIGSNTIRNNAGQPEGNVIVSASTVVMAQYNTTNHSIGVVWHELETDMVHMDVYFCSFDMASQTWGPVRHVGQFGTNDAYDQWNPAIDVNSDGTYLVTWYDKHPTQDFDNTNEYYRVVGQRLYANGTLYDLNETIIDQQGAPADPFYLYAFGADPFRGIIGTRTLGEYQGIWEWNGVFNCSTTYIDNTVHYQDIYAPRVTLP